MAESNSLNQRHNQRDMARQMLNRSFKKWLGRSLWIPIIEFGLTDPSIVIPSVRLTPLDMFLNILGCLLPQMQPEILEPPPWKNGNGRPWNAPGFREAANVSFPRQGTRLS